MTEKKSERAKSLGSFDVAMNEDMTAYVMFLASAYGRRRKKKCEEAVGIIVKRLESEGYAVEFHLCFL